jgi:fatty acid desaturase
MPSITLPPGQRQRRFYWVTVGVMLGAVVGFSTYIYQVEHSERLQKMSMSLHKQMRMEFLLVGAAIGLLCGIVIRLFGNVTIRGLMILIAAFAIVLGLYLAYVKWIAEGNRQTFVEAVKARRITAYR